MSFTKKGLWLIVPGLAGFMLFYVVPFFFSFYYALIDSAVNSKFVGFNNFIEIIQNKYYRLALGNTFRFTLTAVPLVVLLSFILALLLVGKNSKSPLQRATFVIPVLLPSAAVIMIWQILFGDDSALIGWLAKDVLGMGEHQYIQIPVYAFFIWKNTGFNIILFMAGMTNIPKDVLESCEVEGAGFFKKHYYITFPLLLPTLFFITIISIVNSFKIFKEVYLLYGAYPSESIYFVQHYMNNHFSKLNYQNLTAGAIIFALMVYILVAFAYKTENRLNKGVW